MASKSTTLVKPNKTNGKKEKDFCPTVDQVFEMHNAMKGWYNPRDRLIRQFIRMHELQSPFGLDKAGMQDGGIITANGDVEFDIATFPFDILSLAQASMDNLHPQAYCMPRGEQTEDQTLKFEKLANAVLDMRMQRSNFNKPLIQKMGATGWAILFHPYDPDLNFEGEFPFDIQVMNPLGVFPQFDQRGEPLWVTYERRVSGAQLKEGYGQYEGVDELFKDEPDTKLMSKSARDQYNRPGMGIMTSTFTVIRFYNNTYTSLLLYCGSVSDYAARNNPTLKKYKNKGTVSVLVGSAYSDEEDDDYTEYAGVLEHHLGRVPFSFGGCWPELRDNQSGEDSEDGYAGRYYWLPFLFSQYSNWRNISRILSAFHSTMIRYANRPYVTDSDVTDTNRAVIKVSSGEAITPLEVPSMPPEGLKLLEQLMQEVDRSSFAPASYGAKAGTSGAQQDQNYQAGSVRMDTLRTEAERVTAKALYAIGYGIIEQGDETFSVYGSGEKYDGPYTLKYTATGLDYPPAVKVKLVANTAFVNAEDVLKFKTLADLLPQETLYAELLNLPNPKKTMEKMRQEMVDKNDQNLAPYVQLGALEKQNELFKKTTQQAWDLQKNQDEAQLWVKKEQAILDQSQVNEENQITQIQGDTQMRTLPPPGQPNLPGIGGPSSGGMPPMPQNGQTAPPVPAMNVPQSGNGLPPNLSMPGQRIPMQGGTPPMSGIPQRPPILPQPPPQIPSNLLIRGGSPQGQGNPASVPLPSVASGLQRAPDNRGQPMQNMGRDTGLGNPGLPSQLIGANTLPGKLSPALQAVNRSLTEPSLTATVQGTQRSRKKPRRAKR